MRRKDFSIEARINDETFVGDSVRYIRNNRNEATGEKLHANIRADELFNALLEVAERTDRVLKMSRSKRFNAEMALKEFTSEVLKKAQGRVAG